jgi:hypothetical protein
MEKNLTEKLYEELRKRNLFEEEDDEDFDDEESDEYEDDDLDDEEEEDEEDVEDDDDEEDEETSDSNEDFCEMMCNILHSRTQAHVFHLQTKSYAEHKALNAYYDQIVPLFDAIIETYQGKYGIIKTYQTIKIRQYKNSKKTIAFFESLLDIIEDNRDSVDDGFIQNQIDTVEELINSTLYKLKFLK